jgi:hypothetical protein
LLGQLATLLRVLIALALVICGVLSLRNGWLVPWLRSRQDPQAWGWFAVLFGSAMLLQLVGLFVTPDPVVYDACLVVSILLCVAAIVVYYRLRRRRDSPSPPSYSIGW